MLRLESRIINVSSDQFIFINALNAEGNVIGIWYFIKKMALDGERAKLIYCNGY